MINDILKYNIKINNRAIVASICINELKTLYNQVDFIQDRHMLDSMLFNLKTLLSLDLDLSPLKLLGFCDINPCIGKSKCATNCCNQRCNC